MKVLEVGTYGKSRCAHDLVDILNNGTGTKNNRLVARILNDYFSGVIDIMKTEQITETVLKMWLQRYKDRTNDSALPTDIKTRVNNLIVARYRTSLNKVKSRK